MFFLFILLLILHGALFAKEQCVIDDIQLKVCLQNKPERIISLSPHITELIFAIGAEDRLAAVIQGSDYPPEANNKTIVGNFQSVSTETIIQQRPDLVVAWPAAVSARTIARLKNFGITIYHSDPKTLAGIEENILELSILTGQKNTASVLQQSMQQELKNLRDEFANKQKLTAVVLIADRPLMALSNRGLIKEAFSICGAENSFPELLSEAAIISPEALLKRNPDVILTTFPVASKMSFLARLGFSGQSKVRAAEINPDLLLRQTPRFLQGVRDFCLALHPELSRRM